MKALRICRAMLLCLRYVLFQTGTRTQHYSVDHIASTTTPTTKAPCVPSGQDLGGPFWFCPCIPTGAPEGPGGGMVGPIMPKLQIH